MGSLPCIIRIAMLNADTPVPNVAAKTKTYGNIFHNLLSGAASRIYPRAMVESQDFDVVQGEYPESISNFTAVIISGSASSSYDDEIWINKLNAYLTTIYHTHPRIKIIGSCFGHQIICQSLVGESGCKVEKDPNGWELGVQNIQFTDEFRKKFLAKKIDQLVTLVPTSLRLQFVHADHVKIPAEGLPDPWVLVGATKHCAVQGVYEPGHVLTFQGHFEFDRFVNFETVKVFGAKWEPGFFQRAMDLIDADDDAQEAAEMTLQFILWG